MSKKANPQLLFLGLAYIRFSRLAHEQVYRPTVGYWRARSSLDPLISFLQSRLNDKPGRWYRSLSESDIDVANSRMMIARYIAYTVCGLQRVDNALKSDARKWNWIFLMACPLSDVWRRDQSIMNHFTWVCHCRDVWSCLFCSISFLIG